MMPNTTTKKPSQNLVPIKEVREGIIILKDNSLRAVVMTSSLNFSLKSNEEQSAIILQYQNFLNSLDFSIQFYIQSRNLNIEPYLDTLRQRAAEQTNELLKIQTREYIDFVTEFVATTKIVSKTFYLVIPYTPTILSTTGKSIFNIVDKFLKKDQGQQVTPQEKFEEYKLQLQQRIDSVVQGLSRMGLRGIPLNTEELIELFYGLYNPGETEKPQLPSLTPNS